MRVIRNPFSDDVNKEFCRLIERNFPGIKSHLMWQNDAKKTVATVPEWKNRIDRDSLMKLYSQEKSLDKNNTKNLNNLNQDISGERFFKDIEKIRLFLKDRYKGETYVSGNFYYPPTGYMGWHTNCEAPGERFYITWASEDNKSFFRYYDDEKDEIITDYDDKGLTVRQFTIPTGKPYFWHCVGSECDRFSFGFLVNSDVTLDFKIYQKLLNDVGKDNIANYINKVIENSEEFS